MITLEDCLEELVGEIVDEHDEEDPEVQHLPDGDYLVDGGMSIDDLNDLLDLGLPDDDWETVAGFLFGTLEHVPTEGESVSQDGWRFTATEVEGPPHPSACRVSLESDREASTAEPDTR